MTDWQPIETAPKDGTSVIIYHPSSGVWKERIWISHWIDRVETTYGRVTHTTHEWAEASPLLGFNFHHTEPALPTHWMPMPDAPE